LWISPTVWVSLLSRLIMSSSNISIYSVIFYVDIRYCRSNNFHAWVNSYCRRFNRNSLQSPISLLWNRAYLFLNVEIHFCLGRLFTRTGVILCLRVWLTDECCPV
jgi:hypothetical protein